MFTIFWLVFSFLRNSLRSRAELHAEILALRHQLLVLQRSTQGRRVRFRAVDRVFWVWVVSTVARLALSCSELHHRYELNDGLHKMSLRCMKPSQLWSAFVRAHMKGNLFPIPISCVEPNNCTFLRPAPCFPGSNF
jgi:hypothetical protein